MPKEFAMANKVRHRWPPLTADILTPYPTATLDTHNEHQQLFIAPNTCPHQPSHSGSILGRRSTHRCCRCPLRMPPHHGDRASPPAYMLACPPNQPANGLLNFLTPSTCLCVYPVCRRPQTTLPTCTAVCMAAQPPY